MEKRAILQAMSHMSSRTCINFRPTKGEKGHLRVYKRLPGWGHTRDYIRTWRFPYSRMWFSNKNQLFRDTTGWSKLCGAELGYAGDKPHILVLGEPDCFPQGRILHELMHVAGFPHEHSRPDRDKYIKIIWRNLLQESRTWKPFIISLSTSMIKIRTVSFILDACAGNSDEHKYPKNFIYENVYITT